MKYLHSDNSFIAQAHSRVKNGCGHRLNTDFSLNVSPCKRWCLRIFFLSLNLSSFVNNGVCGQLILSFRYLSREFDSRMVLVNLFNELWQFLTGFVPCRRKKIGSSMIQASSFRALWLEIRSFFFNLCREDIAEGDLPFQ